MELSKEWQLQEAKNRLSEVIRMAEFAPQSITLRGKQVAVVISKKNYEQLTRPRNCLAAILKSAPESLEGLQLPERRDTRIRKISI
ncbi:MAG: type II toxin-antitoxin system Phd/YefM family antitoxin [Treponema sp.]|nr:type II toxin-antitoxin system Phd/YefM family antitoxin [Treponema sp.]